MLRVDSFGASRCRDRGLPLNKTNLFNYNFSLMTKQLRNIHPGEVLEKEFLEPSGISAYRLSQASKLPRSRLSEILAGKRGVTAETALRLSQALGTSADFWLNLQAAYDLEEAERKVGKKIASSVERLELVA